jgi:hypothetical protein
MRLSLVPWVGRLIILDQPPAAHILILEVATNAIAALAVGLLAPSFDLSILRFHSRCQRWFFSRRSASSCSWHAGHSLQLPRTAVRDGNVRVM